ncbi:glycosyltransferase family 39 protein [Patescibacteria group bacterium]|nr:glycosyltransferase family 39 protein [Patescibacteria group bacterium]
MRLNSKKTATALFLFLLGLGTLVRLVPVISGNIFFWFDQGLDTILVKQLVIDHKINLVSRYSGLAGVLMGPIWTWLMAIPFALSRGNPISFTIFLSILSLTSSVITFFLVRKYLGPVIAIIVSGITLLAPVFVTNSTIVASPHPLTFLFIFFIWCSYELFINQKRIFWVPLLVLTGLFFQFEIGFALFTLPVLIVLFVTFRGWRTLGKSFLMGLFLVGLTFLPQVAFDFRHDFLISRGILKIFSGSNSLYGTHASLPQRFLDRAWSFGDDFLTMVLLFREWFIVVPTVILMLWGSYLAWKKKLEPQLSFIKICAIIIVVFYVGFSFYPGPLWVWYRAGLPIVYALLFSIPLGILWQKYRYLRLPLLLLFLMIIYKAISPAALLSEIKGSTTSDTANLKVQQMVLDYVYSSSDGKPFAYFAYTPPVYDYIWQYDFWQYGQQKYKRLPENFRMSIPLLGIGSQATPPTGKEGLFYVIIEPNRERPWEIAGWEKSFIKIGKILETQNFPGDIIVEKRITE